MQTFHRSQTAAVTVSPDGHNLLSTVQSTVHVDAERCMPLGRLFYNTSPQSPHHTLCRQQRREADKKKPLFFYAYKSFNRCNALIALEVLMAVSI